MRTLNVIAASALLSVSGSALAITDLKTVCTHGNQTRVIEVVYSGETAVPCEVRYTKSEGSNVLWSAANAEGYCESKATAFIDKQKNWGWDCSEAAAEIAEETAAAEITTEAPAETVTETVTETTEAPAAETASAE